MKNSANKKRITNNQGMIVVDFIFAFILILGFVILLMLFSITLSAIEVTQYITFASARNYMAAQGNEEQQRDFAKRKYRQLVERTAMGFFYRPNWFELEGFSAGETAEHEEDPALNGRDFVGVSVVLNSKILDFAIPFFGSTDPTQEGFRSVVQSFLRREPTAEECNNFNANRFSEIRRRFPLPSGLTQENTLWISDNGC